VKKRISVIVPAYNEQDCVEELARRLAEVFSQHERYDFEALIIENGSHDATWERLALIHTRDPRFKVIRLSRNFRMDGGLTAGLHYARGDAAVLMTADLQDPPELIGEFLRKWEEGFENIYMVVTKRSGTGLLRRFNSRLFYWVAARLTGESIPQNASDYRLVDRKVYETVRRMDERNRFVRGLFAWAGFKSVGVEAERPPRYAGASGAHSLKVIDLALKGIFAHSYLPLKLITLTGVALSILSLLALVPLAVLWIFVGVPFAGFGTVISTFLLLFGVLAFMIGIVAEYVGLVYEEVKQRPNFVVTELLGIEERQSPFQ
jgi:glycosyltransferase involved in cell wall biosynthesis